MRLNWVWACSPALSEFLFSSHACSRTSTTLAPNLQARGVGPTARLTLLPCTLPEPRLDATAGASRPPGSGDVHRSGSIEPAARGSGCSSAQPAEFLTRNHLPGRRGFDLARQTRLGTRVEPVVGQPHDVDRLRRFDAVLTLRCAVPPH